MPKESQAINTATIELHLKLDFPYGINAEAGGGIRLEIQCKACQGRNCQWRNEVREKA